MLVTFLAGSCPVDEIADRVGRQYDLRQKPDHRAGFDHVDEVLLGVGGDQYYRRWRRQAGSVEQLCEFEAVLATEVNVDQCHVRTLGLNHCGDTVSPCYTDRAHLHPDRSCGQRGEHAAVAGDGNDGIGMTLAARAVHWYDGEAFVIVRSSARPAAAGERPTATAVHDAAAAVRAMIQFFDGRQMMSREDFLRILKKS